MRLSKIIAQLEDSLLFAWHKATAPRIYANTSITDKTLQKIANMPTRVLSKKVEADFWRRMSDKDYMRIAVMMAEKGQSEGGCPIGSLVVCNDTGIILGKGHNRHIQEDRVYWHGETDAINDAGTDVDFSHSSLYTTLTPCSVCTSLTHAQGFCRIVIGNRLASPKYPDGINAENENLLKDKGVEVIICEDERGIEGYKDYAYKYPEQDTRDWQGVAGVMRAGLYGTDQNISEPGAPAHQCDHC